MSLVRESEGDGWVSELLCSPNKSLITIRLNISPSFLPSNQASRVKFGQKPAGGVRTDSDVV